MAEIQELTPEELQQRLSKDFPPDATCWSQATDEVRDLCRRARELAGGSEDHAVNFRALSTPAQWNAQGIAGTARWPSTLR